MESYKHQFAKQTLARWIEDAAPELGTFTEYPFCLRNGNHLLGSMLWRETGWIPSKDDVPTYQECLDARMLPICIFDVVVHREGIIVGAYEIVHKHDLTEEKRGYIKRVISESLGLRCVYGVGADWVLSQVARPSTLRALWAIEG